jgi:hypothetical protein
MDIRKIIREEVDDFDWVKNKLTQHEVDSVSDDLTRRTIIKHHPTKVYWEGIEGGSFYPQFLLYPPVHGASIYKHFHKILKHHYDFNDDDIYKIFELYRMKVLPYIKQETGL